jgi:hypothetical protein
MREEFVRMDVNDLPDGTVILLPRGEWRLVDGLTLTRRVRFRSLDLIEDATRRALEDDAADASFMHGGDEEKPATAADVTGVSAASALSGEDGGRRGVQDR